MFNDPKKIICNFINEKLSNDISRLKTYCFSDLEKTPYGKCSGMSGFDCDNTLLANAIYVFLWGGEGNIFPNLRMENLGRGKTFRGDTMNSFRTVLGDYGSTIAMWENVEMGEEVKSFFRMYHTIGNFIVLPNGKLTNGSTFNTYRGRHWGDFFDQFLIELGKVLSGRNDKDAELSKLADRNREALEGITMSAISDAMFLRDYSEHPLFAPYLKVGSNAKTKEKNIKDPEFRKFASFYMKKSTEIITSRANAICRELERRLFIENFENHT